MQENQQILQRLRKEILPLQGYQPAGLPDVSIGCRAIEEAFPNNRFPLGAVHEFLISSRETATASAAFIAGISSFLLKNNGVGVWIGNGKKIFPPALTHFNIDPSRIIFVDVQKEQHLLWATEEALKCNGLMAVISEVRQLNFVQSRRYQLAVEQSRATGFLLHYPKRQTGNSACVARWKINTLPSAAPDQLPGVGYPRWHVELLKVRNGRPGKWIIEWDHERLISVETIEVAAPVFTRKAG